MWSTVRLQRLSVAAEKTPSKSRVATLGDSLLMGHGGEIDKWQNHTILVVELFEIKYNLPLSVSSICNSTEMYFQSFASSVMLNYVKEIYLGVWPQNANLISKKKWVSSV